MSRRVRSSRLQSPYLKRVAVDRGSTVTMFTADRAAGSSSAPLLCIEQPPPRTVYSTNSRLQASAHTANGKPNISMSHRDGNGDVMLPALLPGYRCLLVMTSRDT